MKIDEDIVQAIWEKGRAMADQDPTQWRMDECGAWIYREHYGLTDTDFGWKIEKVTPGVSDGPNGFRPFHHRNGYNIANGAPHCHVTANRTDLAARGYVDKPRNREL